MKVRVRRDYFGEEGKTRAGQIIEMSEHRFRQLTEGIHKSFPLVDPVEVGYKMIEEAPKNKVQPAPQNKMEGADRAAADPTDTPPTGGQTGEGIDASSLVQAQRLARRISPRQRPKPNSSQ